MANNCLTLSLYTGGTAPTDLRAEQTGLTTVLVTWTEPSPAPSREYEVASANISETTTETSHNVTISQVGVHTVKVKSLYPHYPSETVSVEVTVRGERYKLMFYVDCHFCINYL